MTQIHNWLSMIFRSLLLVPYSPFPNQINVLNKNLKSFFFVSLYKLNFLVLIIRATKHSVTYRASYYDWPNSCISVCYGERPIIIRHSVLPGPEKQYMLSSRSQIHQMIFLPQQYQVPHNDHCWQVTQALLDKNVVWTRFLEGQAKLNITARNSKCEASVLWTGYKLTILQRISLWLASRFRFTFYLQSIKPKWNTLYFAFKPRAIRKSERQHW